MKTSCVQDAAERPASRRLRSYSGRAGPWQANFFQENDNSPQKVKGPPVWAGLAVPFACRKAQFAARNSAQ
ncbi:hypothetical protein AGR5A_Cc100128 [Agrobacterium genomosp. 5 str. CFBP 6626]|nr:hypothetical protein AGR5A_Cc100128 [Agrobacterium genomosp. 5 str. CFBP 6626]